jgi:hypothetical protein
MTPRSLALGWIVSALPRLLRAQARRRADLSYTPGVSPEAEQKPLDESLEDCRPYTT